VITIGIDPRKSSLIAVAVQPTGDVSATIRLEVNCDTVARPRAWAKQWPQRQWVVEGAAGLGTWRRAGPAAADEPVGDVPAQLAARARLLNTGHARKTYSGASGSLDSGYTRATLSRHLRCQAARTTARTTVAAGSPGWRLASPASTTAAWPVTP
jgi:transposase